MGWDGLDEAEKRLGIGRFDFALFAIGGGHFNWGTICPPVGIQLGIPLSELLDVVFDVG